MMTLTAVVSLGAFGAGDSPAPAVSTPGAEAAFLTVMRAGSGSISIKGDEILLTLDDLAPQVVAFSDRPDRVSGTVRTSSYIDSWSNEYRGDPPNAALVVHDDSQGEGRTVVLTLGQPELDGRSVRFEAKQVTTAPTPLGEFRSNGESPLPSRFAASSLFIDGGALMQLVAYGAQDVY